MKTYLAKYLLVITFCVVNIQIKAQQATDSSMLIKVNDILPRTDFEEIRSYVWANGDRKTYCPKYTDNPHLVLEPIDADVYFNPSQSSVSSVETDYNIMYIVARLKDVPFNYYLYLTDDDTVYLYDFNKYLKDESTKNYVLKQLDEILQLMKETMVKTS